MATKKQQPTTEEQMHKIRITLTSKNTSNLERVCREIVTSCKKQSLDVKGPMRMPTKVLRVTTRKSPCGEGTNTYDRFEMRIHKRVIDITSSTQQVKQMSQSALKSDVIVDVVIVHG